MPGGLPRRFLMDDCRTSITPHLYPSFLANLPLNLCGQRRLATILFALLLQIVPIRSDAAEPAKEVRRVLVICETGPSNLLIRLMDSQLQHGGIADSRISPGAPILFREPTSWGKYKIRIIVVLTILTAETALVIFLIWLVQRRNRARQSLERQLALEEISHLNRVASLGQMAVSLAHELTQPLAAILSNAQAALQFASRPVPDLGEIRAALADITADNKRARAVVENVRAISRRQPIVSHELDLNDVVIQVERLVSRDAQLRGVSLRFILCPSTVRILGDEVPLQQVMLNLISNGMDAMREVPAERRVLSVSTAFGTDKKYGIFVVQDNGPGIAKEHKPKLFTPFFTTKSTGLGMGLSICRSILDSLGGRITFENRSEGGAVFQVQLPLARPLDDPTQAYN